MLLLSLFGSSSVFVISKAWIYMHLKSVKYDANMQRKSG
jgi:hypothetical protein